MRSVAYTASFRKDYKRLARSGHLDMDELRQAVRLLSRGAPLPERLRDHPLGRNWKGCRECHVRPDWLLIYKLAPQVLTLVRTGAHDELFN